MGRGDALWVILARREGRDGSRGRNVTVRVRDHGGAFFATADSPGFSRVLLGSPYLQIEGMNAHVRLDRASRRLGRGLRSRGRCVLHTRSES